MKTEFEVPELDESVNRKSVVREHAYVLFSVLGAFWVVELLDRILPWDLEYMFGVQAKTWGGLVGVLFWPFLHGDFAHLLGNTVPFVVLGGLVMASGVRTFVVVFWMSTIVGGLGIWLFAAQGSNHIGASGVIFGFLGFLLLRAWFGRRIRWVLVAVVAAFLYGGILFSLARPEAGISWHGHFFGFVGGAVASWLLTRKDTVPMKF
jgi:membrane associated rhomboid family serine protease